MANGGGDSYEEKKKSDAPKERILNEAIDNSNVYSLEPVVSFELENSPDSQLHLQITLKAFQFRSFYRIVNARLPDRNVDEELFSFYLKFLKQQYKMWSSKKIRAINVFGPIKIESFINAHFNVARGAASSTFEFILTDMPFLNPFDWISLLLLFLKDEQKFEPIIAHIKRMLVRYINEVGKMDVEIATALNKKPTFLPKEPLKDLDTMILGRIQKKDWSVTFQKRERPDVTFFFPDKRLNSVTDKKCFSNMINCMSWFASLFQA
ncbi:unnamed protein product [Lactuca saligna]|uniref:Uncharacterized protein n=1 Tax=Lactuca saligna TaxID=75948 RepID=A0AA35Z0X2_LACSI|nr:unnamed protein product [Lactuca saligna]